MTLIPLADAQPTALALTHALSFSPSWPADEIVDLMNGAGALGVAAVDEAGGCDGFVLIRAVAGEAEVLTLCVAPHARLMGIGKALVEAALGLAAGAGAEAIWLEVAEDNEAALGLYRGWGFEESGRRKAYYRREGVPNIDALVLKRALNTSLS